ncbi:hypothetical protein E4U19_002384 [Claviceps sp. Clav32 group G5]|nr:hypothetical protein E4U19_002384 [Claviceps sp. Clav32 group G5]KAG6049117.1 hypothetical protein E4U39_006539 [Claviceps sp. Clav50 group G5]
MDDEDRFSASSPESDRQNEADELMEDGDEGENDADQEQDDDNAEDDDDDNNDDNNDDDNDGNDGDDGDDESQNITAPGSGARSDAGSSRPSTPVHRIPMPYIRPSIRPEAITARLYDIVPTMAAPQSTSINAMAITPDLRYWITGGSDGYIRKYDGPGTINGKLPLTVAQKHPFVDSVTKAGILMSYWENEEPPIPGGIDQDQNLSPVYSLAVHSEALWLLSGLESGGINLQSIRHDEGKRIACLQQHKNAVSSLTLATDERSVLSGAWDKNIFDWDLDTGNTIRSFDGSGGQISSIELRPACGDPVPAEADEPIPQSNTISTNNDAPLPNGIYQEDAVEGAARGMDSFATTDREGDVSPIHDTIFGDSDAGSLFGETVGDQPFGNDDDTFGTSMDMIPCHGGGMDHSADYAMTNMGAQEEFAAADAPSSQTTQVQTQEPPQEASQEPLQDAMSVNGEPKAEANEAPVLNSANGMQPEPELNTQRQVDDASKDDPSSFDPMRDDPLRDEEEIMAQLAEDEIALSRSQPPGPGPSPGQSREQSPEHSPAQSPEESAEESAEDSGEESGEQSPERTPEHTPGHSPGATAAMSPSHVVDQSQMSTTTFLSSAIDGTIRIWDKRVPSAVARIATKHGVPPWCMSACWSPDGNMIYAGRRNGTVEEYDLRHARRGWEPERALKFPTGSGAVSAVRSMPNGKHLVCASYDITRLYDLRDTSAFKHSTVPFLIIPGPPRAGVISSLYIDPTCRFMLSAAGTRGWEGTCTEALIGYEIQVLND